jgi:hypothetical protein
VEHRNIYSCNRSARRGILDRDFACRADVWNYQGIRSIGTCKNIGREQKEVKGITVKLPNITLLHHASVRNPKSETRVFS